MSIHDFYSKLVSESEKNRLFGALRRLSLLPDPKCLSVEDVVGMMGWIPWEECEEEGTCQCAAMKA